MSGIYIIRNKINNKVYVGQSVNTKLRIANHKNLLRNNKHENKYLQNSYNKYGYKNFEFKVIEKCKEECLDEKERYWIGYYDSMNRNKGYNRESGGNKNKHFDDERIKSITGKGNPMYGKHHTDEVKEIIRKSNRGRNNKLTEKEVSEIKVRLCNGEQCNNIAKAYKVQRSTISKIKCCVNWEWVRKELNEELLKDDISDKVIELYKAGNSINKICEITNKGQKTISNIVKPYKKEKERYIAKRNELIIIDYKKGLSKEDIIKKHNISKTTYVRIISKTYNENKIQLINSVKELKQKGYMNKEIAKMLNLHRTTVTEYLKK